MNRPLFSCLGSIYHYIKDVNDTICTVPGEVLSEIGFNVRCSACGRRICSAFGGLACQPRTPVLRMDSDSVVPIFLPVPCVRLRQSLGPSSMPCALSASVPPTHQKNPGLVLRYAYLSNIVLSARFSPSRLGISPIQELWRLPV